MSNQWSTRGFWPELEFIKAKECLITFAEAFFHHVEMYAA